MMVAASGANFGFKRTLPHMLGISLGFPVMLIFVGVGADLVVELLPKIQRLMNILGTIYLLYLAYLLANSNSSSEVSSQSRPLSFLQAALFQWVNPKAWVIALSAIASFSTMSTSGYLRVLTLCIVFFFVAFLSVASWTLFGSRLSQILKTPSSLRIFNLFMAFLLVLSVVLNFI